MSALGFAPIIWPATAQGLGRFPQRRILLLPRCQQLLAGGVASSWAIGDFRLGGELRGYFVSGL